MSIKAILDPTQLAHSNSPPSPVPGLTFPVHIGQVPPHTGPDGACRCGEEKEVQVKYLGGETSFQARKMASLCRLDYTVYTE